MTEAEDDAINAVIDHWRVRAETAEAECQRLPLPGAVEEKPKCKRTWPGKRVDICCSECEAAPAAQGEKGER
jgi:hypothetical protein